MVYKKGLRESIIRLNSQSFIIHNKKLCIKISPLTHCSVEDNATATNAIETTTTNLITQSSFTTNE